MPDLYSHAMRSSTAVPPDSTFQPQPGTVDEAAILKAAQQEMEALRSLGLDVEAGEVMQHAAQRVSETQTPRAFRDEGLSAVPGSGATMMQALSGLASQRAPQGLLGGATPRDRYSRTDPSQMMAPEPKMQGDVRRLPTGAMERPYSTPTESGTMTQDSLFGLLKSLMQQRYPGR